MRQGAGLINGIVPFGSAVGDNLVGVPVNQADGLVKACAVSMAAVGRGGKSRPVSYRCPWVVGRGCGAGQTAAGVPGNGIVFQRSGGCHQR